MQIEISNVIIECLHGDIADQRGIDAVVNAANAELRIGGGVAGAIHEAAGPELEDACEPLAPIEPGEAVITPAFALPNKYVIHCLGPVYGRDEPSDELLAQCYRAALELAEQHEIESIAFPSISTGAFGYPLREAAHVAMRAIGQIIPTLRRVKRIRFVLWSRDAVEAHVEALKELAR